MQNITIMKIKVTWYQYLYFMLLIYSPLCYIVKKYHRGILGLDATVLLGHKQKLSGKDDWSDRPNRKGTEKTVKHRPRVAMTPSSAQHTFLFKNNQQNQHHLFVVLVWNGFPVWPFGSVSILSLGSVKLLAFLWGLCLPAFQISFLK